MSMAVLGILVPSLYPHKKVSVRFMFFAPLHFFDFLREMFPF
jgi:hypothetical protein